MGIERLWEMNELEISCLIDGDRYIAEVEHDCKTGIFNTTDGVQYFRADDGIIYTRSAIQRLWKINDVSHILNTTGTLLNGNGFFEITTNLRDISQKTISVYLPAIVDEYCLLRPDLRSRKGLLNETLTDVWGESIIVNNKLYRYKRGTFFGTDKDAIQYIKDAENSLKDKTKHL